MSKRRMISGIILLIFVYLIVNMGQGILKLWRAQDQIAEADEQVRQLAREQYELRQQANQVQSEDYVDLQIHNHLHLGKPGETLVILPDQVPMVVEPAPTPVAVKQNWELWWERLVVSNK